MEKCGGDRKTEKGIDGEDKREWTTNGEERKCKNKQTNSTKSKKICEQQEEREQIVQQQQHEEGELELNVYQKLIKDLENDPRIYLKILEKIS